MLKEAATQHCTTVLPKLFKRNTCLFTQCFRHSMFLNQSMQHILQLLYTISSPPPSTLLLCGEGRRCNIFNVSPARRKAAASLQLITLQTLAFQYFVFTRHNIAGNSVGKVLASPGKASGCLNKCQRESPERSKQFLIFSGDLFT